MLILGQNIGAILQTDQAEADLKVARAKAEERRAAAVASEQENIAEVAKMKAKVVEAEAEVPRAIADAFRNGKLGVMDYYNIRNIQADTEMRTSIHNLKRRRKPMDDLFQYLIYGIIIISFLSSFFKKKEQPKQNPLPEKSGN